MERTGHMYTHSPLFAIPKPHIHVIYSLLNFFAHMVLSCKCASVSTCIILFKKKKLLEIQFNDLLVESVDINDDVNT